MSFPVVSVKLGQCFTQSLAQIPLTPKRDSRAIVVAGAVHEFARDLLGIAKVINIGGRQVQVESQACEFSIGGCFLDDLNVIGDFFGVNIYSHFTLLKVLALDAGVEPTILNAKSRRLTIQAIEL
jgi:hypothetical protein